MFNQCATEVLKHVIPDDLVRGTDLFSLKLLKEKITTANSTVGMVCVNQSYTYNYTYTEF